MHYGETYPFSFQVLDFADMAELKRNGVLLYIQEADGAYINAISGENHISYKLNYSSDIWEKQSVPQIRKSSVVPAYHMNKIHWNSIALDGTVPEKDIKRMIGESYDLTKGKGK